MGFHPQVHRPLVLLLLIRRQYLLHRAFQHPGGTRRLQHALADPPLSWFLQRVDGVGGPQQRVALGSLSTTSLFQHRRFLSLAEITLRQQVEPVLAYYLGFPE